MRKRVKHEWSGLTHHSRINFIIFALLFAVIGGYVIINSFAATTTVTCDLYASPSGLDTNSGTISAPFKTVQYLDSKLSPGQTGCLRAGVYGNKTTTTHILNKNGTSSAQITIRSYPGELAEIDGFIEMGGANNSGQYTTLSYLKINGTNTLDTRSTTYPQCGTGSQGLQINGVGDIFEYNEVLQDAPYRANGIGVGWQVSGAGWTAPNNAIIRNNKLHSVGGCADEDHIIYLAHGDNVQIYNNWMWDDPNGWGVQLYPGPTNAKIYNNVIDSAGSGFVIGDTGGVTSGNQIYHNIVVNSTGISNQFINWAGFPGAMLSCSSSNNASTNNLVHDNISFNNPSGVNYDCSTITATLSNNLTTNPLFADANYKTSHDYRLATNSPAISWGMWDGDLTSIPSSVSPTTIGFENNNTSGCTGGVNTTPTNTTFTTTTQKAYEGSSSAAIAYLGGVDNAYARCVVTVSWQTDTDVWYGGAFFLPTGFATGSNPMMQQQVDLMRWDNFSLNNTSQDWGGLIIQNSDKLARLKRFNVSGDYVDLTTPFALPENRWVWMEVHQKLSPINGQAVNEIYMDGVLKGSSTTANTYGREVTRIRYGLVAIGGGAQTNPLNLWLDRATISTGKIGPLQSTPKTGDLNADGVVNVFDLSILLSNYGKTTPTGDLNNDTVVNIFDLSILLSNYGK